MKKRRFPRAALFAALCLALSIWQPPAPALAQSGRAEARASQHLVVGYFAGWSVYRGYTVDQVPAEQLTHLHYAFATIDGGSGAAVLSDPVQDGRNLAALQALKQRNPDLRLILSIGGWNDSAHFSDVAATAQSRQTFAKSCAQLIRAHNLDGVDLDWEYPVSGGAPGTGHRPQDQQNFTLLLQAIRQQLDQLGRQDGRTYSLSIAAAADAGYLNKIEPVAVSSLVDYVFLMTYDLHGPWDGYADLSAPLYTPQEASPQYKVSVFDTVQAYLKARVPAQKLVLGLPLYGYVYQGVSSQNSGLYSRFSSARAVSYDSIARTYLSSAAYQKLRHTRAQVPYLYGGGTFLSYDDAVSLSAKAALALQYDLGGIGFWELSQDSGGALIGSAWQTLQSGWHNPFVDVAWDAWYRAAVQSAAQGGWMTGTSATAFSPQLPVTRGMLATALYRMAGSPASGAASFSDVGPTRYDAKAIAWASAQQIVTGYGDGRFGPDDPVTREQTAAMLYRYARVFSLDTGAAADLSGYADAHLISPYARRALQWACAAGLMEGRLGARLAPASGATRAEIATLLTRLDALS